MEGKNILKMAKTKKKPCFIIFLIKKKCFKRSKTAMDYKLFCGE
jgi:hypothetical protein